MDTTTETETTTTFTRQETFVEEYRGKAITSRISAKGNIMLGWNGKDIENSGSQITEDCLKIVRERVDKISSEMEAAEKRRRFHDSLSSIVQEFGEESLMSILHFAREEIGIERCTQLITCAGKTYRVELNKLQFPVNDSIELENISGGHIAGIGFREALEEAITLFYKSLSRRKKHMSAEVSFCLDVLDENWAHSCEQEASREGRCRYWWHGDKGAFIEHFVEDACSGVDYLEFDFKAEFCDDDGNPVIKKPLPKTKKQAVEPKTEEQAVLSDVEKIKQAFEAAGKPIPEVYAK